MSRFAKNYSWTDHRLTRDNTLLSRPTIGTDIGAQTANAAVDHYVRESISENTRRAYRFDLAHFKSWGGNLPASADDVARYLAENAEILTPATLARRIATISKVHSANSWPNPCRSELVRTTLQGIRRAKGTAQKQAKPLLRDDLFLVLDSIGESIRDRRDRALLLLGWAGGMRASELVGLRTDDIEAVSEGLILHLRRSKTDQEGKGRKIGIPLGRTRHCPVTALATWQKYPAEKAGPLFCSVDRHGKVSTTHLRSDAVSTILRNCLCRAGLASEGYSGHSLRAGFATSAIKAGVPNHKVRAQTGHASDVMLGRYVRDAGLFEGNAVLGLL
ncbi:site-specific integrase [Sulfitobacter sp. SK011]|uniref:site-specific integrase n=1 Tax=Sulfitobacter sp. SK011 TaxID=1389004 RepID=UPI000E0C157F|nr:site-specific integrase [Sulfitobacter sp. SK011]AXI42083.1 integrase [Sulfitobacter sp. SK011]